MKCLNAVQLECLYMGKMAESEASMAQEHMNGCERCRADMSTLPLVKRGLRSLADAVLHLDDCPSYEVLSEYVDGLEVLDDVRCITAHSNCCEVCWSDIQRIRELRAQAYLRKPIVAMPGLRNGNRFYRWTSGWKWSVVVGATCVAILVFALVRIKMPLPQGLPKSTNGMALSRQVPVRNNRDNRETGSVSAIVTNSSGHSLARTKQLSIKRLIGQKHRIPSYLALKPLAVDGKYIVVLKNGRRTLMLGSKPALRSVDTRIVDAVQSKLRTGRVKSFEPFDVAMAKIYIRDDVQYVEPAIAPKLIAPVGEVIMSTKPLLEWNAVDLAQSYRVIITDNEGRVVYDIVTPRPRNKLDASLTRGYDYAWRVGIRFAEEDGWAYSQPAKIRVLSNDGQALIEDTQRQLPGSRIALGAVYEALGLQDEAQREYVGLEHRNPHSSLAHEMIHGK